MELTGQELEQLKQALLKAYDVSSLKQMLRFKLEKDLDVITTANGFNNIVFDLINIASKEGWLIQLISVAKDHNPNNKALNAVATTLLDKAKTILNQPKNDSLSNAQTYKNQQAPTLDRKTLFNQLCNLVPGQFNQLLFEINPPSGLIPSASATQAERVYALLQWAESPTGSRLSKIQEILEAILTPLASVSTLPKQSNIIDRNYLDKQTIPEITFNKATIIDIGVNELKDLIPKIEILLLTVNHWERKALLSEMTPLDGKDGILQGALDKLTYRIGMFGNYCAAYTESTMGSGGRHGVTLTAKIAVDELKPKAVLLLGIAFGIDSNKQKLGDVLIAESIQPYEFQKVNKDFSITYRGQASPCGHILSERFRMRRGDWIPKHGDKSFDEVKVHQGLVLSGDKLVNNKDFRDALVKAFPTAIGGEMEGAGAYSAVSSPTEVILIKSICDWADGDKNDKAQPFAAFTAVSLAKHVLSKPDVLHPLINSDNQNLENKLENQTHQPYQNSANAFKQITKAENNTSIAGVVQVNGSNSTINIHSQSAMFNVTSTNRSLLSILETRKQDILDDIAAAYKQLGSSLNNVDKIRINRLIADLGSELAQIQNKINSSVSDSRLANPVSASKHNLPKRNRFFTGHLDLLNQLTELINLNKGVAIKQAISGMDGVGKTQIALEFCHLHINDYQTILWVHAENEASFNNSYYSILDLLNLAPGSGDGASNQVLKVDEIISLVKRWLANNHNWLMVLDKLEDPKLIKDYLPANHQGHILITTRSQSLKGYASTVQLKKMSLETGTFFLLKRTNLLDNNLKDELIVDAQKIVQAMDGLPLALEQAGAYIQKSACSLADYLAFYRQALVDKTVNNLDDHDSVFITFNLAFDKVRKESVTAAKLLEVCSFLDSDLIPEEIFTQAGNLLGDELAKLQDNTYEFNKCLKLLLNYSLIERDTNNKSLSIHRLVQTVIRELISEQDKKILVECLAKVLYSLSRDDAQDPMYWPKYQKLLPSISRFFDFAKLYQSNVVEFAYLFHQFGIYCYKRAFFAQSLTFYNLAFDIYKQHFGDNHPFLSSTLNNIGEIYRQQGNYLDALDFYNQALSIRKHHFGDNHPSVADSLNNIGLIYDSQGNYPKALDFYNQSLSIKKHHFGDNHPSVADTLNNIGEIYRQQGNYPKALDFFNQSLKIYKHHFGDNHPSVADTLNNIGLIYDSQGNYLLALDFFNQSLEIYKHHFGDNHPDIANSLSNIGIVYKEQGNYPDALDFFNQALSIKKHHFGDNHPDIADSLNNIGAIYNQQGNYPLALDHFNQALAIRKHLFGDNHPSVADSLNNIGSIYASQGNYSDALGFFNQALSTKKFYFGDNHPSVADTLNNIGQVFRQQGNYPLALDLFNQSLTIYKQHFGDNHPSVADTLNNIGQVYHQQDNYSDALDFFNHSLKIYKQHFGDNHLFIANFLNNLAFFYKTQGVYSEAKSLYIESLGIREAVLGNSDLSVATSLQDLANLYVGQAEYSNAEPLYIKSLHIREAVLGNDHQDVATSLNNLSLLYYKQEKYTEAEPLCTRALQIRKSLLGNYHLDTTTSLNNLANLYLSQGRYDEAKESFTQVLEDYEKMLGDEHLYIAKTLNSLSTIYRVQGKELEAESLHKRSLSMIKKMLVNDYPILLSNTNVSSLVNIEFYNSNGFFLNKEKILKLKITNNTEKTIQAISLEIEGSAKYKITPSHKKIQIVYDLKPNSYQLLCYSVTVSAPGLITLNLKINDDYYQPTLDICAVRENPYIFGPPIQDVSNFFGRETELQQILGNIISDSGANTMVIGEQRSGKTSLLYQIRDRLKMPYIPIEISLVGIKGEEKEVLIWLLDQIIDNLKEKKLLNDKTYSFNFKYPSDFFKYLKIIIQDLKFINFEYKLILLLDEAHSMKDINITFQEILRETFNKLIQDCRVVFACYYDFYDSSQANSSPLQNIFDYILLKPLEGDDLTKLITEPAKQFNYFYSNEAKEAIKTIAGGHPAYTQIICAKTFDIATTQAKSISLDHVKAAEAQVITAHKLIFKMGYWNSLKENVDNILFLKKLITEEPIINISKQVINKLQEKCLIKQANNKYYFTANLFKSWVKQLIEEEA